MGRNRSAALLALLLLLGAALLTLPVCAAEEAEPSLDEVLEGFDDGEPTTDGEDDLDTVLEGFEDEGPTEAANQTAFASSPWWDPDGYLKIGTAYNFAHDAPESGKTDWRGFSRLRTEVQADINPRLWEGWQAKIGGKAFYDAIYRIRGRDEFTDAVLDNYETELELREAWLQGRLTDDLDLKVGRQIAVWGKSDNIRITDVLNPLDMREPGLTDIEDLRLPVAMTRLDYYFGDWSLTGIAVHEHRYNKLPEYGSDFYPGAGPPPPECEPAHTPENTEFALALSGIFSGWDAALYMARIYDDLPHAEAASEGGVRRIHSRLFMIGGAYNIALGNWLVKAEAAFFDGFEFFNAPDKDFSRLDALVGLEYSGFSETTISLEIADRRRFDFDPALENPPDYAVEDEFQTVLRYVRDFRNDALTFTALVSAFGAFGEDGALARLDLEYDLTDHVQMRGGVTLYWSGDLYQYQGVGGNDRGFLEVEYNF